jgi:sn-glycerol 3-phosphate transport system substrate-binding protein
MSQLPSRTAVKWIGIVATAALLLAACGSSGGGGGGSGSSTSDAAGALPECPVHALDNVTSPVDLVVWHTQQAKPLETMQALADKYNASQSKVKVRLDAQGTAYPELMRKFQSAVPSKQLPGLVMFDDTATQTLANSNVVMPAQACINADNYDMSGFLQVAQSYYTIKNVLWPVSANLGNVLLYYNKGQFRKAGLDPNNPPKTLAEVRDAAQKIKDLAGVAQPLVQEMSSWKTEFWMTGAHSSLVNNDNGRGAGQTDAGNIAGNDQLLGLWQWFQQMKDDGLMQAIPATEGQINQYLAMANQQASMLVDSSSAATSVESFLQGKGTGLAGIDEPKPDGTLDIGASVFPGVDAAAGNKTQMGGAAWYMTNTGSPEVQAAAWDFAKFMNTPESQAQMLIGGSYLPYRNSAADLPESKAFFGASLSGRWLEIAYEQVKQIDPAFPGPLIGPYDEFRKAIGQAQDEMMFNGKGRQAAADEAQAAIDAAIKRYNSENF